MNKVDDSAPLISVVVPAYNAENTIRETLDSALNQSHENFELLVIDDGSTDATATIVAGFDDSRVRCLSFPNAGPSAARNRGMEHAAGEFVAFLDADDLWLPDKLASQVSAMRQNPDAGLAFSWHDLIDESGNFLKAGPHMDPRYTDYKHLIVWNFVENGSTPMVRRAALSKVGSFDETLRYGEDWDMWLRLAHRYAIVCIPVVHVLYRLRQDSASADIELMVAGTVEVLRRALDRLPPSPERVTLDRTAKANLYHSLTMRLVETSTGRRSGLDAARYWWQFIKTTPDLFSRLGRVTLLGCAILAILVLPPDQFSRLRRRWSSVRAK